MTRQGADHQASSRLMWKERLLDRKTPQEAVCRPYYLFGYCNMHATQVPLRVWYHPSQTAACLSHINQ